MMRKFALIAMTVLFLMLAPSASATAANMASNAGDDCPPNTVPWALCVAHEAGDVPPGIVGTVVDLAFFLADEGYSKACSDFEYQTGMSCPV